MTPADFGALSEALRRATVSVASGQRGRGSGVVWSADGLILTNSHVLGGGPPVVELWDGRRLPARIELRDSHADLAALRVDAGGGLPAPLYRDSDDVRPGELAIAVGNPLGFSGALTRGVVHAVGPLRGLGRRPWIQADIQLAPGNSGGPLADAGGRVIGLNTMIAGGVGLAIPSARIARFLSHGPAPRLGVTVRPTLLRIGGEDRLGLAVLEVETSSPAQSAGVRRGDIIVAAEGRPLETLEDLSEAFVAREEGTIEALRGEGSRSRRETLHIRLPVRRSMTARAAEAA